MMYVKALGQKSGRFASGCMGHWQPFGSGGMNGSSGMEDRKDGFMSGRTTCSTLSQDFLFSC